MDMGAIDISRVINDIMNSKNFPKAAGTFVEMFLGVFTTYKYIVKLQSDEGRYVVSLQQCAFLFDPRNENELTASALHTFAVQNDLCTKSRVSSNLALAVLGRYLTWETSENDKRMKVFKPTERYLQMAKDTYFYYAVPLSIVDPEIYGKLVNFETKFVGKVARYSVKIYLEEMRIAQKIRGMHLISYRDGGYEVLMLILREARFFSPERMRVIALPYASVARELGISRSQVQKLVKSFSEIGLVALHGDGGKRIELMPALDAFATDIVASMLGIYAAAVLRVMQD